MKEEEQTEEGDRETDGDRERDRQGRRRRRVHIATFKASFSEVELELFSLRGTNHTPSLTDTAHRQ